MSKQKVYCASTAQVRALHDAMPEHLPVADVDFIRGVVHPVQQWPNKPLKTAAALRRFRLRFRRTLLYCGRVGAAVAWRVFGNQRSAAEAWVWLIERARTQGQVDIGRD